MRMQLKKLDKEIKEVLAGKVAGAVLPELPINPVLPVKPVELPVVVVSPAPETTVRPRHMFRCNNVLLQECCNKIEPQLGYDEQASAVLW